jgi:undecaprenyl-diphosphatase
LTLLLGCLRPNPPNGAIDGGAGAGAQPGSGLPRTVVAVVRPHIYVMCGGRRASQYDETTRYRGGAMALLSSRRSRGTSSRHRSAVSIVVLQSVRRVILPVAGLLAVIVGLGLLVTKVLYDDWPFTSEDAFNRALARDRTESWNAVSLIFSTLASTPAIIAVTAVVAVILRVTLHRWREPLFLAAAVSAQAVVFFFATLIINRSRPDVLKMDVSPPTSSFPSGHTSAAVALYAGLALLLALLARRTWLKVLCCTLILVPVAVGLARMYRGMHHPTDVLGSFVNGGICIAVMARSVIGRDVTWGGRSRSTALPEG